MFSHQEAVTFLQTQWGLQEVGHRLSRDRHTLLDDIVKEVQVCMRDSWKVLFSGSYSQDYDILTDGSYSQN